MKIGIFGDSFAEHNPYIGADWIGGAAASERKSWVDYVGFEKDIKITNHAVRGSSLYYSYAQFKKYQRSYDKIIFIVTDWGRLWVPNIIAGHAHIPGLAHCEVKLKQCEDEDDRNVFQAAYDYYVYLENIAEEIDMHKLMVNEIMRLRSDALLIPVFKNDISCFVPGWEGPSLGDIAYIDNTFYKIPRSREDLKHCHLNNENNLIFSKHIIKWINDGTPLRIDLNDYVEPNKPVEYYFKS